MIKHSSIEQEQFELPNIDLIEKSELGFSAAFLSAAQTFYKYLQQCKSSLGGIENLTRVPLNLAIQGLFSKMCRSYYSYVLLEIHQDKINSQYLLEQLIEAAITITYFLEEDPSYFSDYIATSIRQAHFLLHDVEQQLRHFPSHPDLLVLQDKLNSFITNQQQRVAELPLNKASEVYLWGPEEANTTAKRGMVTGLNFLTDPARHIALSVMPASWLDLQLNYLNSISNSFTTKEQLNTNFKNLRDATHLCLHATRTILQEVAECQNVKFLELEHQQQLLNRFYEWFYQAYKAYRQKFCTSIHIEKDCDCF